MDSEAELSIDDRLEDLFNQTEELLQKSYYRSALGVYNEIHRLAKREKKLQPYMRAVFHQMDLSKDMCDPKASVEKAVELIGLLERPERAALIESNFDQSQYERTVGWMSACAYENLADATGMMEGYNSEGMHACINDGIDVCRRTGKLACIQCFREYATDVYTSGEDLSMALHHAQQIVNHKGAWSGRGDRRWLGNVNSAWLFTLAGQLDRAADSLKAADETCQVEGVNIKVSARLRVDVDRQGLALLRGEADLETPIKCPLPPGESPLMDRRFDHNEAVRLCCRGEFAAARALLETWDKRLAMKSCLNEWFETRLRLIATYRLADEDIDALAQPLFEKAKAARDYLTLHRLNFLANAGRSATPAALLGATGVGPFASPEPAPAQAVEEPAAAPPPPEAPPPTPLEDLLQSFYQRLDAPPEAGPDWSAIVGEILAIEPGQISAPPDAGRLVHLLVLAAEAGHPEPRMWDWTQAVVAAFPQNAALLNLQSELGDLLRSQPDSPLADRISVDDLERDFRQSLDLDPFNAHSHARAGGFFLRRGNIGEAERCLARAFRLMRTHPFVAKTLADIYDGTDRSRDALAVLDLALREGSDDPGICWQAALLAHRLEQWEAMLAYLDYFEKLVPNQPWCNYYSAIGYIETGRPDDALAAIAAEEKLSPNNPFPLASLRACAHAKAERSAECRNEFETILSIPLTAVETLTIQGLTSHFARLWPVVALWPENDGLRTRFVERMLASALTPDDFFEPLRQRGEPINPVHHYRVTLRQPLDSSWPQHQGCLARQKEWTVADGMWGMLARSEEEATQMALDWHRRIFPNSEPEVLSCEVLGSDYNDKPGIVWQGPRTSEDEKTTA